MLEGPLVVFRVQDCEGRGPWRAGFSRRWVEARDDHANLPPWFVEFGLGAVWYRDPAEVVACGCQRLADLRRWVSATEYKTLTTFGYRAVRIEADRIICASAVQCLFARRRPLTVDVIGVDLWPADAVAYYADIVAYHADIAKMRKALGRANNGRTGPATAETRHD